MTDFRSRHVDRLSDETDSDWFSVAQLGVDGTENVSVSVRGVLTDQV